MTDKSKIKEDVNRPVEISAKQEQTRLEASTEFLLKPSLLAAKVIDSDKRQLSKDFIDLQYTQAMLERSIGEVKQGNLADVEAMLYSQAYALNVMFATLMTRANRQEYMPPTQALMSLAFKAQNQSRATLQALVDLKQPRQATFVKQANISQGHQQVNNLAEKNQISQNKLLEGQAYDMDSGPQGKAKKIDSEMEAVGKVYRCKNSRRQSKGI
ncbi:hypothetical protein [Polynucleobacter sp.]|uniref:hypothetical protein n=1 Tax=Polynucleobacter sp. TaxID=2029855 RepID=UPI00260306D9|nr:hypothetical protein [Polynucleobacter sp.]MCW1965156.1 hypothetical protein [Polynucleobacter sp.]